MNVANLTNFTINTAPESAPENFNGVATSPRSLQLFWSPPPISEQNGIVRSYTINTTEVETGRVQGFIVMNTTIVLTDLHPYYQYICTVAAYTVALGPTARITLRTLEAGEIIITRVIPYC